MSGVKGNGAGINAGKGVFMKSIGCLGLVLKEAARGWTSHRAQRLGAALAFYTTFSLAPLTIIAIAVAGYVFGEEAARGGIVDQIRYLVGKDGAIAIESLIQKASVPQHSWLATMFSIGLFVFAATGVFAELKDSLDTIWEVKVKPGIGLWVALKTRLLSFAVVVGTGFLLMVSLLLTAMLTAFTQWLGRWLPVSVGSAFLLEMFVSFIVITFLFALIFKLLPDVTLSWKDVWIGAASTAVLFIFGKSLIGAYIGSAGIASIYGAAGSLVVVLVWIYYSSQILFFGAELIRAQTKCFASDPIAATAQAEPMTRRDIVKQSGPPDPERATIRGTQTNS